MYVYFFNSIYVYFFNFTYVYYLLLFYLCVLIFFLYLFPKMAVNFLSIICGFSLSLSRYPSYLVLFPCYRKPNETLDKKLSILNAVLCIFKSHIGNIGNTLITTTFIFHHKILKLKYNI